MTLQNEKFEEMVSRQLAAELEPQRGKALAAFRAHMAAEQAAPAPIPLSRGRSRKTLALWAGVPSLLAACVAVAVTLHFVDQGTNVPNPGHVASTPTGGGTDVASSGSVPTTEIVKTTNTTLPANTGTIVFDTILTGTVPGNIVITNDNTPVREVNQIELRQRQIVDPNDHSTTTITEPVQQNGYVPVRPY